MSHQKKNYEVVWAPQPGPQTMLLTCPADEIFFGGARGGGKTDGCIGDFVAHSGRNGKHARGVLFRRTYPELDEVLQAAKRIMLPLGAVYKVAQRTFEMSNGSSLRLRHLSKEGDAEKYQGHQYTWMAFDELTNWATSESINKLRACLRSPVGIKTRLISTGNPGGPGHNWVKSRYIEPARPKKIIYEDSGLTRVFIPSRLKDNPALTTNDPFYIERLKQSGPSWLVRAWVEGDWNIVAGGMFDDVWSTKNLVESFAIPNTWRVDRSFDWGSSRPYSVGWWAESDGTAYMYRGQERTVPRGSLFRIGELYGSVDGKNEGLRQTAVEVARIIREYENTHFQERTIQPGPADSSIYNLEMNGRSIAQDMAEQGISWTQADKRPGSRKLGWERIRTMMRNAGSEEPGLYIFNNCRQFIRTVPTLTRDTRDPDDVDSNAEDHIADETRYRLMATKKELTVMKLTGL